MLVEARDGVQELQDELARASRRLEDVDWAQRGGEWPPAEDRRTLLRTFAEQCQATAHQAEGVEARLAVAQRILTSGRHEIEAIDPQTEEQVDDLARLRHTALGLHRALEEARVDLQRTQASLHRSAAAARESAPEGRPVEVVHTDLLSRTLRAASTEGHRLDEVVSRASSQAGATLRSADPIGDAARERMKVRRDVGGGAGGLPAPGVDR